MLTVSDLAAVSSIMTLAHWSPGELNLSGPMTIPFPKKSAHSQHFTLV
jgi:hypothetical protein